MRTSLIITTYEWPEALEAVLRSALDQRVGDYEIIVADDGSGPDTAATVRRIAARARRPITHVWQEDRGFRAGRARNKAVARAGGNYLVFIDGDTIVGQDFVADHLELAEPGYFVAGSRIRVHPAFVRVLLDGLPEMPVINRRTMWRWWLRRRVRRIHPAVKLHLPAFRYVRPRRWQAVFACNLGVHKADFVRVNGFNNSFVGWGHEDSELAARFFNAGILRKEGKLFSYVGHLEHGKRSRHARWNHYDRLQATLDKRIAYAADGYREVAGDAAEPSAPPAIGARGGVEATVPRAADDPR